MPRDLPSSVGCELKRGPRRPQTTFRDSEQDTETLPSYFMSRVSQVSPRVPCPPASAVETHSRTVSPDNTCGKSGTGGGADGYTCPSTLPCCSVNGFCGSTNEYCLTTSGCQSAFGNCTAPSVGTISPDETCGITGAGTVGYTCGAASPCCSGNGWCGNTTDYCNASVGCQSAYGTCNNDTTTSGGGTGGTSTNGQCGPGQGTCASNECCSLAGFCGTTEDYCAAPDCQFTYGPACDANKIPAGTNTSSIPRTQLGSVLYGSDGIYDCVNPGDMALTFDDGPFIYTSHILDVLAQYNASATFFITGNNNGKGQIDNTSLAWPALIQRMYNSGHQVASHTWSHPDLCNITSTQRKNEMYKNEMALRNILGVIPTYMRPPYSSCTAACGCEADLFELGYVITYFDLDTQDYLNDSPTLILNSESIFDNALAGASSTTDDFLVISHDIHNQTSQVLVEYMLKGLLGKGYKPVTVGECLGDPKANWYRIDPSSTLG
ncbi:carbohydrate esterase family 4 protein [Hyaloscypha bicolor E]|uniref:Carbohydrate esterase family 4 protein n=1 Tax=Hyaloscypha bicolor E TaxID=1095630 RepID=A0A2J6SYP0_9HELO|nr:carbohydrate esterase family 4 protein [Hyaloscypha bicolor E]PMD55874.1 carbohydrate esterase family 4 protein [Hyaloscypha bicolor E]